LVEQNKFWKEFCIAINNKFNSMKKLNTILVAVLMGLICSCTKSELVEPIQLQDSPHKKDTTVNNSIPRVPTNGNARF